MRLGILCYASNTGLGYQTRDYAIHLQPDKILAVDLSPLNGMPINKGWYGDFTTIWTHGIPQTHEIDYFLNDLDIIMVAENPLNYYLFAEARRRGIKIVQAYNYEFLEYLRNPNLPPPDLFAAPTNWNFRKVEDLNLAKVEIWPVPIDTYRLKPRKITELKTLVHIIGRPAAHDRNGTKIFIELAKYFGRRFNYKIYLQPPKETRTIMHFQHIESELAELKLSMESSVQILTNMTDNASMYLSGDLLILPRRYGGLCLPMIESLASGMPVIMPNIEPNDSILPATWLASCNKVGSFQTQTQIDLYDTDLTDLIRKVEWFQERIRSESVFAKDIASSLSWSSLENVYLTKLQELCLK